MDPTPLRSCSMQLNFWSGEKVQDGSLFQGPQFGCLTYQTQILILIQEEKNFLISKKHLFWWVSTAVLTFFVASQGAKTCGQSTVKGGPKKGCDGWKGSFQSSLSFSIPWGFWEWYCWWKKSCTTKDDDYPIIYKVLTIPGGAGFCPSTVSLEYQRAATLKRCKIQMIFSNSMAKKKCFKKVDCTADCLKA